MQLKGARRPVPVTGPLVPLTNPPFHLQGLFNYLLVGHSLQALIAQVRGVPLRIYTRTHPNKDTVCANYFGILVCKRSRKRQKEFARIVCGNSLYLGGCFLGVGCLPGKEFHFLY